MTAVKGWKAFRDPGLERARVKMYGNEVAAPVAYAHPDGRTALVGREPVAEDDWRWHVSVRHGDPGEDGRVPSWEELVSTAHELRPGICFAVAVPPRSWWINVHPHVLHLWEIRDPYLVEMWRQESRGDQPT